MCSCWYIPISGFESVLLWVQSVCILCCVCNTQMYYYKFVCARSSHNTTTISPSHTKPAHHQILPKHFLPFQTISLLYYQPQTIILSAWILFNLLLSEIENCIKWKHEIKEEFEWEKKVINTERSFQFQCLLAIKFGWS